jgi:hypothetical protein
MSSTLTDVSWLKTLQNYVYTVITAFAVPETTPNRSDTRKKLVGPEAMKIWIRVFTHRSYEPTQEKNNETLEFLGDRVMGSIFPMMLISKNPTITESMLTDIANQEIMKEEQAKISDELGLWTHIRSLVPGTTDSREDLMETTFGGLLLVGDEMLGPGNGHILCRNMMIELYGKKEFDLDKILKNKKMQLKEIGDKLQWWGSKTATINNFGLPQEIKDESGYTKEYRLVFRLTDAARGWMARNHKLIQKDGVIANVIRPRKKEVIDAAVDEALENLKAYYGLDLAKVIELSQAKQKNSRITERTIRDGYKELEIDTFGSEDGARYYQLIGRYPDGKAAIIYTFEDKTSSMEKVAKDRIFNRYAEGFTASPNTILVLTEM